MRVHLVAACGVGMSALAGLLHAAGHRVTGSDEHVYPPASTLLEELGIPVFQGYDSARLAGVDLVVCGNAVRRTNPEAEAAEAGGLRMLSMPAAVEEMFLAGRSPLVVAGTHGKTTSSAMLAWVLERTGRGPGFLVGGVPRELERSFALGRGPWFVIEGDEYDSAYFDKEAKFLHYRPAMLLLNAIEFDHADIYRDLEHVKSAFRKLLGILPAGAPLIACGDFPHVLDVIRGTHARVRRFGLGEANDWRITDLTDDGATRFTVREAGRAAVFTKASDPIPAAERLAPETIVADLERRGVPARTIDGVPAIRDYLVASARPGDVIAIMSNGAFGGLPTLLVAGLAAA